MTYDLDALNKLSTKEKEVALSILQQFSKEGKSKLFEDLKYADYKEIPVDIITFIKDNRYLGKAWHLKDGKFKLFPYWENKLKELFPDNLTTSYNTFIESGARGLGKSEIAVTCALYLMHRLMCLKDPYTFLNLKPTEQVAFAFMNITEALAYDIGVVKFQNTVQASPWFLERGTLSGTKEVKWNPPSFMNIIVGSQPRHVIGQAIYFAFFDEISFIANQDIEIQKRKALDMIDTAIGGMKTRFTFKGKNPTLLTLASSKRSEKSFLEEHIKKKNETDKENTLIVDEPVWNVRPPEEYSGKTFYVAQGNRFLASEVLPLDTTEADLKVWRDKGYKIIKTPIEYEAQFRENIDRALCDFAGISSSELTTYISGARLLACKKEGLKNPFTKDVIEVGNAPHDKAQYYDFFDLSLVDPILKSRPLYIHLDMSMTGDKTGIGGVWILGKKPAKPDEPQSKELYYRTAFSVSIKAPKGYQVSFEKNRQFIYWLKEQGFNIKGVSADTFQSADLAQQLLSKGYNYTTISVDRVDPASKICLPYQYFKSTIYEERIEMYDSVLLTEEILGLERSSSSGKVDHSPNGINCFTGDTKISLTDGRELTFLEVIDELKNKKELFVYTFNEHTRKIEPKRIMKGWCSGHVNKLIKITLDNNESIECTPDHRFMLRDGTYCKAKDLVVEDSLMPLYRKYPETGLTNYRLYYEPIENKWHYEHRQFAIDVEDEKYLVHHKDCNPRNNNPTNLIWMSKHAHNLIHTNLQTGAQSDIAKQKRKNSVKKWWDENKNSDEAIRRVAHRYPDKTVDEIRLIRQEKLEKERQDIININNLFNIDLDSLDNKSRKHYKLEYSNYLRGLNISGEKVSKVQKKRDACMEYFNVDYSKLSESERRSLSIKYARIADPTYQERVTKAVSENHKAGKYSNAVKALQQCNMESHKRKVERYKASNRYKEILEINELYGIDYESLPSNEKISYIHRYHNSKNKNIKNHKILKIEFIDKEADVYDISVEDNHNFALSAGVIVHNSKDSCDAICGALWNASQNAEQFAFDYGETLDTIMEVSKEVNYNSHKKQIQIDFENTLQSLLDPLSKPEPEEIQQTQDTKNDAKFINTSKEKSVAHKPMDFGMGPAEIYKPAYLSQGIVWW